MKLTRPTAMVCRVSGGAVVRVANVFDLDGADDGVEGECRNELLLRRGD